MKLTRPRCLLEFLGTVSLLAATHFVANRIIQNTLSDSFILFYVLAVWITAKRLGGVYTYLIAALVGISRVYPIILSDATPLNLLTSAFNLFGVYLFIGFVLNANYAAIDKLQDISLTDALTGALNVKGFKRVLDEAMSRSRRKHEWSTVVFIDVDGFKSVNDTRGHREGDYLLKLIAEVIQTHLRPQDYLCRIGGDEFAIMMCGLDPNNAKALIDRMKTLLDWQIRSHKFEVSFSIGVVCYNGTSPATGEDLIHAADALMYEVKKSTKNAVKVETF